MNLETTISKGRMYGNVWCSPRQRDTYTIAGYEISVSRDLQYSSNKGRSRVVYVDGETEVSMEGLEYGIRGEDPAMDKAWDRHNRQVIKNQRAVIEEVVAHEEFDKLPEVVKEVLVNKLTFSRYAGCRCGCSPGFKTPVNFGINCSMRISKAN